jgi:hypothetical protein
VEGFIAIQAATVALFVLQAVKWIIRKLKKDPNFTFAPIFYTMLIPFLTALSGIGLGLLGWTPPVPLEWQTIIQWGIAILLELGMYHMGLEPIQDANRAYREERE